MKKTSSYLIQGFYAFLGLLVCFPSMGLAQIQNPAPVFEDPPSISTDQITAASIELTDKEVVLSYSVLLFGLIILLFQAYLLRLVNADSQDILLNFTLTVILIGGLYLVTIGLSSDQIAPAFSLYGAIVGYLLGRESSRDRIKSSQNNNQQ